MIWTNVVLELECSTLLSCELEKWFHIFFNHHHSLMSDNPTLHYTSPNLNLAFNMHPCLHGGEGHPKHLDKSVKSSQHQLNFSTSHISKENTVKLPPEFTRNLLQYLNLTNPNVSFWECFRDSCPWKLHFSTSHE